MQGMSGICDTQLQNNRVPSSPTRTTMNPQLGNHLGCSSSGAYASHVHRNILFFFTDPIGDRLCGSDPIGDRLCGST